MARLQCSRMTFTEKMTVWTVVLEYGEVFLGYPVTIPVIVGFLCWLFRERIGAAIDAIRALSFKGASVELAERVKLVNYDATVEQTKATAQSATRELPPAQAKTGEALASFFSLAARTLHLIPKGA